MRVACLAFTEKGYRLAKTLAEALSGTAARSEQPLTLRQWTKENFARADALIYVGAAGIAVRAIAPYLRSKTTDPAVVAVDECAHFAVPLASGHLGGANGLARRIGAICGAVPVITTATDANGLFAVDEWARCQQCAVAHTENIRRVSGALLAGQTVRVKTSFPIEGEQPSGIELVREGPCSVYVGMDAPPSSVLWVIPRRMVLGIGCRKGIACADLETVLQHFGLPPQAVCRVASIDLKAEEPGLLDFCAAHGWKLETYSAEELAQVPGTFTASAFVAEITGVDNVCERAAVLSSGGTLVQRKQAGNGVTMAAALQPFRLDWRFQDEW